MIKIRRQFQGLWANAAGLTIDAVGVGGGFKSSITRYRQRKYFKTEIENSKTTEQQFQTKEQNNEIFKESLDVKP